MASESETLRRDAVLREIRDARFTHGVFCPHCAASRCQRWGGFSGRQRYRCTQCRRTFSDLTATPAAYLKRLEQFSEYRSCMRASISVRRAGALLGVSKDTTFRWRHRLLFHVRRCDPVQLRGYTEVADWRFAHSAKGRSTHHPRQRGLRWAPLHRPSVWVSFVTDRLGGAAAAITGNRRPGAAGLRFGLERFIGTDVILITAGPRLSGHATFATMLDLAVHCRARARHGTELPHTRTVTRYIAEFRSWLKPFLGVSTRYLENYLTWFSVLRRAEREHAGVQFLHWPVPPPLPTIPADTARGLARQQSSGLPPNEALQ